MGKKVKTGKQRKDKYYHLAKEAGYRSRAAFKLIQLNKRFEFLQNSQKLVDLCAAPGGWLQVASQNMPVSCICIGVDLVPIRPIPKCITIQGDIREEKTRQLVRKELQRSDADCVLHDGAPNVGLNWGHDAFQQNILTLYALRLTTQILKRNGYFVTKIFRSADYLALIAVFEKLFKKVHVWKPAASRLESAEIFVVCERYLKPDRVDPDLLDVKMVFEQMADEPTVNPIRLLTANKKEKKKKAEGYNEEDLTQFHNLLASEFILSSEPLLTLSRASCVTIDEDRFDKSCHTTDELRECLRDVKVCGPAELRLILQWRKKILADIKQEDKEKAMTNAPKETENEEAKELRELEEIDQLIRNMRANEKAYQKKKKRQQDKARAKMKERKEYEMLYDNDTSLISEDMELFSLNSIRRLIERREKIEANIQARKLEKQKQDAETEKIAKKQELEDNNKENEEEFFVNDESDESEDEWETRIGDASNNNDDEQEKEHAVEMKVDDSVEENEEEAILKQNLVHTEESYMTSEQKAEARSQHWFLKIKDMLDDEEIDEVEDLDAVAKHMKGQISKTKLYKNTVTFEDEQSIDGARKPKANYDEDFDDYEKSLHVADTAKKSGFLSRSAGVLGYDEDEDIDSGDSDGEMPAKKRPNVLTARDLALAEQIIYSAKKANNLEEWGWNRYTFNDPSLPDWFVYDERKHYRKEPPVAAKRVEYYEQRNRDLNVRPIKKVLEANARKKKRKLRRMIAAKKRAENVLENENLEHSEKVREMKKIYKRANKSEKKDVKYQVISKGKRGTMTKPKGPFRLVDKRLKKDKRGIKKATNKSKSQTGRSRAKFSKSKGGSK